LSVDLCEIFEAAIRDLRAANEPEEEFQKTNTVFGGIARSVHDKRMPFVEPLDDVLHPVELLLPLKALITSVADIEPEGFSFSLQQRWEHNYQIIQIADPYKAFLEECGPYVSKLPESVVEGRLAQGPTAFLILTYPHDLGRDVLLQCVFLHEACHVVDWRKDLSSGLETDLELDSSTLDRYARALDKTKPEYETFMATCKVVFRQWIREIVADLVATRLFGPALLFARRRLGLQVGVLDKPTELHPDSRLRNALMLDLLEAMGYLDQDNEEGAGQDSHMRYLRDLLVAWREVAAQDATRQSTTREYEVARASVVTARATICERARTWDLGPEFNARVYAEQVPLLSQRLRRGVPPDDTAGAVPELHTILNAAWLVALQNEDQLFEDVVPQCGEERQQCYESLNELTLKAIDNCYLLQHAQEYGLLDGVEGNAGEGPPELPKVPAVLGLSASTLKQRWGEELIVTPLLSQSQIGRAAVDLRLGTQFIIPRAGDLASFDPDSLGPEEVRRMQEYVNKASGHDFVLHPRRLVLGQTLEYIVLPKDMCGMVLSRSRYGRLGLVVATAIFVHPGWKGCLTLELVNYGDIPIQLHCGSGVAQLVLFSSSRADYVEKISTSRRLYPTRAEFARLPQGKDENFLQHMSGLIEDL